MEIQFQSILIGKEKDLKKKYCGIMPKKEKNSLEKALMEKK